MAISRELEVLRASKSKAGWWGLFELVWATTGQSTVRQNGQDRTDQCNDRARQNVVASVTRIDRGDVPMHGQWTNISKGIKCKRHSQTFWLNNIYSYIKHTIVNNPTL